MLAVKDSDGGERGEGLAGPRNCYSSEASRTSLLVKFSGFLGSLRKPHEVLEERKRSREILRIRRDPWEFLGPRDLSGRSWCASGAASLLFEPVVRPDFAPAVWSTRLRRALRNLEDVAPRTGIGLFN